ncbi:MAG: hypothetical protein EPO09_21335 [Aquabacterium sp.]|uniref:hypothetical protein n=1 Tax=Aquabacterium sp. TaxID=1872578 RepID=UPI00120934EA|nr:hypothetical protein [Aquabacterium sp.]TAK83186.1 MAG: hypothetical protein EPO09_21335 [Aquabacterium sp.]
MKTMDRKSKIFFLVFGLLIAASVAASYYRYIVRRDYIVQAQADCDPATEKCFVHTCDPATETCAGDAAKDTSYYQIIRRNAKHIPLCDPSAEDCAAYVCPEGERDCSITLCDEATLAKEGSGDVCNDPTQYTIDHPATDEGASSDTGSSDGSEPDAPQATAGE